MASSSTQAQVHAHPAKPPRDFRQEVTDSIAQMLDKGVAPWQKPWDANALAMPLNPTSERAYRGGNAIHLMAAALRNGFEDPRWMTYKQAADQGRQVRRGEKGTQIEFWEVKTQDVSKSPDGATGTDAAGTKGTTEADRPRYIHRVYTVFNAKQIDNIPPFTSPKRSELEIVQAGESILSGSGAKISYDQSDRAYYNRAQDSIHLPDKNSFQQASGYYALKGRNVEPGLVHHSDRGVQYASNAYTDLLKASQIEISMSRKANPWDNAACESFMKTLKYEEVLRSEYRNLPEARASIREFLEKVYNEKRLHSSLDYVPPAEFEANLAARKDKDDEENAAARRPCL